MKNYSVLSAVLAIALLPPLQLCAAEKQSEVPNAPAIRAQAEEFKFKLEQHRKGVKKLIPEEEFILLNSLASQHKRLRDVGSAKRYEQEAEDLLKRHPEIGPSEEAKARALKRIEHYKTLLKEYHDGKRGYRDAYLILQFTIAHYVVARQKDKIPPFHEELEALKKEHPDLVKDPPNRLEDEAIEREKEEEAVEQRKREKLEELRDRATVYRSSDNVAIYYFGPGNRIEFFKMDIDDEIFVLEHKVLHKFPGIDTGKVFFKRRGKEHKPIPKKVLRFELGCSVVPASMYEAGPKPRFLVHSGSYPGQDPNQMPKDFREKEFYGIVGLDGTVVFQIPFHADVSESLIEPLYISVDGNYAVWGIGALGYEPEADYIPNVVVKEFLVWEFPDKVRRLDIRSNEEEVKKLRSKITCAYDDTWEWKGKP